MFEAEIEKNDETGLVIRFGVTGGYKNMILELLNAFGRDEDISKSLKRIFYFADESLQLVKYSHNMGVEVNG